MKKVLKPQGQIFLDCFRSLDRLTIVTIGDI